MAKHKKKNSASNRNFREKEYARLREPFFPEDATENKKQTEHFSVSPFRDKYLPKKGKKAISQVKHGYLRFLNSDFYFRLSDRFADLREKIKRTVLFLKQKVEDAWNSDFRKNMSGNARDIFHHAEKSFENGLKKLWKLTILVAEKLENRFAFCAEKCGDSFAYLKDLFRYRILPAVSRGIAKIGKYSEQYMGNLGQKLSGFWGRFCAAVSKACGVVSKACASVHKAFAVLYSVGSGLLLQLRAFVQELRMRKVKAPVLSEKAERAGETERTEEAENSTEKDFVFPEDMADPLFRSDSLESRQTEGYEEKVPETETVPENAVSEKTPQEEVSFEEPVLKTPVSEDVLPEESAIDESMVEESSPEEPGKAMPEEESIPKKVFGKQIIAGIPFAKKGFRRKALPFRKRLLLCFGVFCVLCCLAVGGYVFSLVKDLPTITAEDLKTAQTSYVYDQNGNQIAELHGAENRTSVSLAKMPQYLQDALVGTEDVRFYEHNGVDVIGIFRALKVDIIDSIRARSISFSQGASTLTMQLVKNVVDERDKSIPRKIKQAALAIQFEKNYSKEDILYYYLNEIYLGPQVYGVEAASQYYFDKHVSEITMEEAAMLVAILRAPSYYDPYSNGDEVMTIRNLVLDNLADYDPGLYGESAIVAKSRPLTVVHGTTEDDLSTYRYPWYVDTVISECEKLMEDMGRDAGSVYTGGLRIYTALDPNVQQAMDTVYADEANFPRSSTGDIVESAMAIVEPNTGAVKGLVGGRVYEARRGYNRATDMLRSSGSSIKPLVTYAPAIELGYGSGYVIDDSAVKYGDWEPKNDGGGYMGRLTMRRAVAYSRNICAVKMLAEIGTDTGWSYGNKLGLNLVDSDNNLSLTLGGLTYGVCPLQMAAAYATFASKGVYTEPYTITRIETADGGLLYSVEPRQEQVFTEATAYIMTDILKTAVSSGTGTNARISGWVTSGKTGTNGVPSAKDDPDYAGISGNKDVWFCGYTSALAGAVWLGYDNKKDDEGNIQYLSGSVYGGNYAARLFNKIMSAALTGYEQIEYARPADVISVAVNPMTGLPSAGGVVELFREGFEFKSDGTQWKTVLVCDDTELLATEFCPHTHEISVQIYSDNYGGVSYASKLPSEYCHIHTSAGNGMNVITVTVCTDCSSEGCYYIANTAGSGETGGCPNTATITVDGSMVMGVCPISGHQISSSGGYPKDEPEETESEEVPEEIPEETKPDDEYDEIINMLEQVLDF